MILVIFKNQKLTLTKARKYKFFETFVQRNMANNNKFQKEIVNTLINNLDLISVDLLQQLKWEIKQELLFRESRNSESTVFPAVSDIQPNPVVQHSRYSTLNPDVDSKENLRKQRFNTYLTENPPLDLSKKLDKSLENIIQERNFYINNFVDYDYDVEYDYDYEDEQGNPIFLPKRTKKEEEALKAKLDVELDLISRGVQNIDPESKEGMKKMLSGWKPLCYSTRNKFGFGFRFR